VAGADDNALMRGALPGQRKRVWSITMRFTAERVEETSVQAGQHLWNRRKDATRRLPCLLAAAETIDDVDRITCIAHARQKAPLTDLHSDIVSRLPETIFPGHAAASIVEKIDIEAAS